MGIFDGMTNTGYGGRRTSTPRPTRVCCGSTVQREAGRSASGQLTALMSLRGTLAVSQWHAALSSVPKAAGPSPAAKATCRIVVRASRLHVQAGRLHHKVPSC